MRPEEAAQRPELVFEHQGVALSATPCAQDDRLGMKRVWFNQIDQMLEQTWIAALVGRRADNEDIRVEDLGNDVAGHRIERLQA